MTTVLDHRPLTEDVPTLRPTLAGALSTRKRLVAVGSAAAVGAVAGGMSTTDPSTALLIGTIGAAVTTAAAANWSTCGMSVAGVVAAPKQPGRKGTSTPVRRLGWHAIGSVATGAATGAILGAVPFVSSASIVWMLGIWAALAFAYGLHELGLIAMPAPMRKQQLPRHLRRTMAPWKTSLVFGALIGPGFMIFIRSSAYYLLVLGVLAIGSPALGASVFVLVSLGRCMPSVGAIVHTRRGGSMPGFLSLMCVVDRRVQATAGVALVALASFTGFALLG